MNYSSASQEHGLLLSVDLELAVLKSLRNSCKLILPSLSMSASLRIGCIDPFKPACCRSLLIVVIPYKSFC